MSVEQLAARLDEAEPATGLPDDCPVQALGHDGQGTYWLVDADRAVRAVTARGLTGNGVLDLFGGRLDWLVASFPPEGRGGRERWDHQRLVAVLMAACRAAGLFDPLRDLRGPGVWREAGEVVVHCGDRLYRPRLIDNDQWAEAPAGVRIGRHLYAAGVAHDGVAGEPASAEAARCALRVLDTATWEVPGDPGFVLGWTMVAWLSGLVPTRPILWIEGPTGSGKSVVLRVVQAILGSVAVKMEKGSFAAVRDDVTRDYGARPALLDEIEAGAGDPRTFAAVMEMARYAYYRDQGRMAVHGHTVVVRSAFAFSSCEPPPVRAQDTNRVVQMRLGALDTVRIAGVNLDSALGGVAKMGPGLRRRMLARLGAFEAAMDRYRAALLGEGLSARDADTWGPVLAGRFALLSELAKPANAAEMAARVRQRLAAEQVMSAAEQCWVHLMTSHGEGWGSGVRHQVGEQMRRWWGGDRGPEDWCRQHGLALTRLEGIDYVAVASNHAALERLFAGTAWKGGVWGGTLAQMQGALRSRRVRYGAVGQVRAVLVPALHLGEPEGHPPPEGPIPDEVG